ncbi:hypothetical protein BDV97DRAFT_288608 [Delphinella strobiligena]|nr:hypothetical protein BDV97DRAFT_288608 [Delphinella strobiligena]
MSSQLGALSVRQETETVPEGLSIFLKSGELLPVSEDQVDGQTDVRDPAQIEATLIALSEPRNIISNSTSDALSVKKDDNHGQAISPEEGKRRTQYFEDRAYYRDSHVGSARERIQKDSPVIAELRTNVIVKDEYTLSTDLSYHLSTRYARPESSVMIHVDHSACLLFAGSFEPAYILTISAIPSQVQATMNKRNAALIQSFMAGILSVPPERGALRFTPIPEENLATNGNTVHGEIERTEKQQAEDKSQIATKRGFTRGARRSLASSKPPISKLETSTIPEDDSNNASRASSLLLALPAPAPPGNDQLSAEEKKRRSMNAVSNEKKPLTGVLKNGRTSPQRIDNKRTSRGYAPLPKPPPVPEGTPQVQKVSKRKSFLAVFRK